MKKIWLILNIISIIFVSCLSYFLFLTKEDYDSSYLHNKVIGITIETNESSMTNKELLKDFEKFSEENKINIYRQIHKFDVNSIYNKDVYVKVGDENLFRETFRVKSEFNSSEPRLTKKNLDNFNKDVNIYIKPLWESKSEGIAGEYFFESNENKKSVIEEHLNNNQYKYTYSKKIEVDNIIDYVLSRPFIMPLVSSILLLFSVYIVVSLYEIFTRFKEIAVQKMLGYKNSQILLSMLKEKIKINGIIFLIAGFLTAGYVQIFKDGSRLLDFTIFSVTLYIGYMLISILIYALFLLFIYYVDIHAMIKGKKNSRFINILAQFIVIVFSFILLFFSSNLLEEYSSYKNNKDNASKYSKLKEYSTTYMLYLPGNEKNTVDKRIYDFIDDNYENILLFKISANLGVGTENLIENPLNTTSTIEVNENYFKNIEKDVISINDLKNSKNILNLVVSKSSDEKILEKIKQTAQIYSMETGLNVSEISFNVIYYEDGIFDVLSGNINNVSQNDVKNPYFIVYTRENFEELKNGNQTFGLYTSALSLGQIFMKTGLGDEYASLEPKLIKHKLDTVIRGVTNVYHQYQVSIDTEEKEVFVYGLALIIFFSIYIQLVIFNTLSYYEANMRELFVRYIMGHGFFKLNFEYIMLNIMSICLAVVGYIIIFDTINIAIPVSVIIFISIILGILKWKESRIVDLFKKE